MGLCFIGDDVATYFSLSSRYSPTKVTKSIICVDISLHMAKCLLYLRWTRCSATVLQYSSSFPISSGRLDFTCRARACSRQVATETGPVRETSLLIVSVGSSHSWRWEMVNGLFIYCAKTHNRGPVCAFVFFTHKHHHVLFYFLMFMGRALILQAMVTATSNWEDSQQSCIKTPFGEKRNIFPENTIFSLLFTAAPCKNIGPTQRAEPTSGWVWCH